MEIKIEIRRRRKLIREEHGRRQAEGRAGRGRHPRSPRAREPGPEVDGGGAWRRRERERMLGAGRRERPRGRAREGAGRRTEGMGAEERAGLSVGGFHLDRSAAV